MNKKSSNINAFFTRIADRVSYGMGTPANILAWIALVAFWFMYGIFFIPNWFTSNTWNFPLNTITTLAELYIGFLVAAAANRSERELREIVQHTDEVVTQFEDMEKYQTRLEKKIISLENKIIKQLKNR